MHLRQVYTRCGSEEPLHPEAAWGPPGALPASPALNWGKEPRVAPRLGGGRTGLTPWSSPATHPRMGCSGLPGRCCTGPPNAGGGHTHPRLSLSTAPLPASTQAAARGQRKPHLAHSSTLGLIKPWGAHAPPTAASPVSPGPPPPHKECVWRPGTPAATWRHTPCTTASCYSVPICHPRRAQRSGDGARTCCQLS